MLDKKVFQDEVWKQADRKLLRHAEEPGYQERAKVQAERVLGDFIKGFGWDARFSWSDRTEPAPTEP